MNRSDTRLDGFLTFWSAASFYHKQRLVDGFRMMGFEDLAPRSSTLDASLRAGLKKVYPGQNYLISANKGGLCVYEVKRGDKDEANDFRHLYTYWLDGEEHNCLQMDPYNQEEGRRVIDSFNQFCGYVTQDAVTAALVSIVIGKWRGVTLRPTGGVYWLPEEYDCDWTRMAAIVEGAGAIGTPNVYMIRHRLDAEAVRAVRDGLIAEIRNEAERVEDEVMDPDSKLGALALTNRKEYANTLLDKLGLYENLLGVAMTEIKESVEKVQGLAAIAALRAAAAQTGGVS